MSRKDKVMLLLVFIAWVSMVFIIIAILCGFAYGIIEVLLATAKFILHQIK